MDLGINIRIEGDKVVLEGLQNFDQGIRTEAIPKALRRIASGSAREALNYLTGSRVGLKTVTITKGKNLGKQRAVAKHSLDSGAYPVPRVTGKLRRLLNWLGPNSSKDGFSTGPFEAVLYDSAEYAKVIHEGTGSSSMYGARPFLDDAVKTFNGRAWNENDRISETIREEIAKVRGESGLE